MTAKEAKALLRLPEMGERVLDGEVWTRMAGEFKVSPRGLAGDFDTGCYWVDRTVVAEDAREVSHG